MSNFFHKFAIVTSPENIDYLTGLGSEGWIVKRPVLPFLDQQATSLFWYSSIFFINSGTNSRQSSTMP
jgi:hypothetical protein